MMHRIVFYRSNLWRIRSIRKASIAHDLELAQPDWPKFEYDSAALAAPEEAFLLHSGELLGAFRYVGAEDQDALRIELISE